ncbi:MAG TPA: hypothetical protein PKH07_20085 [bacterium]|nr:hypothetical protein [bacterium]
MFRGEKNGQGLSGRVVIAIPYILAWFHRTACRGFGLVALRQGVRIEADVRILRGATGHIRIWESEVVPQMMGSTTVFRKRDGLLTGTSEAVVRRECSALWPGADELDDVAVRVLGEDQVAVATEVVVGGEA